MKNEVVSGRSNKLISYLELIEDDELYKLKRYVNSDYFNTNQRLKDLFEAIINSKKEHGEFRLINPEELYFETFPNRSANSYNDDFSDLFKLVKGYLIQESFSFDQDAKTRYLIDALINKKADRQVMLLLNREAKNYEQPTKTQQKESFSTYYHNWSIAQKRLNYFIVNKKDKMKLQYMKDVNDNMDKYYSVVKAAYWSTTENIAKIFGLEFEVDGKEYLQQLKEKITVQDSPLLHRYLETSSNLQDYTEEQFYKCKSIFDDYSNRLCTYEQGQFCTMLHNISAVKGFTSNDPKWQEYRIYFLTYQFKLERLQKIGGKTSRAFSFFMYLRLILEEGKLNSFDKELKKFKTRLVFKTEDNKNGYLKFLQVLKLLEQSYQSEKPSKSMFYYDQAKSQLDRYELKIATGETNFPNFRTKIAYGALGLKVYYHQNKEFLKRRSAYQKYIANFKKMDDLFKRPYVNFITLILSLYKLRKQKNCTTKQIAELRQRIATTSLRDRKWLDNRLTEIEEATNLK